MKFTRFVFTCALLTLVSLATAQEIHNWRSSVTGWVWRDGSGQCWRDGSWTPATAAPDCDGAITAKAVTVAPAPEPVAAVAPSPKVELAPAQVVPAALQATPKVAVAAESQHVPAVDSSGPIAKVVPATVPAPAAVVAPAALVAPAPAAVPSKMSFAADTFFDFDKSVLKPAGKAKLRELVEKIKSIHVEVFIVVGHTDNVGTHAYNQKLSERRAEAVKAYLVSLGVAKNSIYTEGKGESAPVADNKTAAGRGKNRRVEVEVVGSK